MPYITQEDRVKIDASVDALASQIETGGELNYAITTLVHQLLEKQGMNYHNLRSIIGDIECMKLELYRRVAAPYEDQKIEENGDVMLVHN